MYRTGRRSTAHGGHTTPNRHMEQLFEELVRAALQEYGVAFALLVFAVGTYNAYIHKLWSARLKAKDEELKRVVTERNALQDIVLTKRLTSGERDV